MTRSGSPTAVAIIDLQDWNADPGIYLERLHRRLSRSFGDSIHNLFSGIQPQVALNEMLCATEIGVVSDIALSLEPVGKMVKLLANCLKVKSLVQKRSDWELLRWIIAEATQTHTLICYFPGAHHDHIAVQQAFLEELRRFPKLVLAFGNQEYESPFSPSNLHRLYSRYRPLEITLRPLSRVESHNALARQQLLPDFATELFDAIFDVSQGFPSRIALAVVELDKAGLIYRDERGGWHQPDDAKWSLQLAETLKRLRYSRPVDALIKSLAESEELQQREHLQNFLLAASVCSPYIPFDWIVQALEIPVAEADRLLDLLTDELKYEDGLPVLEYLAHQIVDLPDTETFRFQNPLLADVLRTEDPISAQLFAKTCFDYHRLQPRRNRTVLAQLLSLAEYAGDAKHSAVTQLRTELRWWIEADLADQFRGLLIESCNNGSCAPEVLWLAATAPAYHSLPAWRRHVLLEAYGSQKHSMSYERRPMWIEQLAICLYQMGSKGNIKEGLRLYYELLAFYQESEPPNKIGIATARNGAGICLKHLAAYDDALKELRSAVKIRETVFGSEHPHTLSSVNELASVLESKVSLAAAESLRRRVLESFERKLGPQNLNTLVSVSNLALSLNYKGDFAGAEPLLRRALEGIELVLGPEHPDVLSCVNNLGLLLNNKGDYAAAEPLFRRAFEGCELMLGPKHRHTLACVNNLGCKRQFLHVLALMSSLTYFFQISS